MAKIAAQKKTSSVKKTVHSKPYPIVGIGASAGGVEAMREFLENLPPKTGMAYVYLQHLDPTHESNLVPILSRIARIKVVEVSNLMKIQPDCLFILPPNKDILIMDGEFRLKPRPPRPVIHMPINYFFTSLAEKQKNGAIGVVLSGNANDGATGLRAIKNAGGITFAQDETAKFWSMPKSAIAEGAVDQVLPSGEIAKALERISKNKILLKYTASDGDGEDTKATTGELADILQLIRKSTGVDFSQYKKNTIERRVV